MTMAMTKNQMALAVSCALALGIVSGVAKAESDPSERTILMDSRGVAVRSGFGLCWHTNFGPPPATPNECDSGPAPVAKAADAAPAPVPAGRRPASQRVTLDADTLFDFNQSTLRPAGRAALDDFAGKSKDISLEVVTVVGHADRFGTEAYNQRLSERRAEAVKTYLVGKGIEPNRIQTEGKGEMQPVTKAGECKGAKSAKVIACLQPDRRVDVEVVGTQAPR